MAGLATVFGSGAMSNSVRETEDNDVIFVIGSNTKENHPVVALRMIKAVKKGAKLIIADPRKVPLVKNSHLWLQQLPGTDVALINGIMHVIYKEGLMDKSFIAERTEDFEKIIPIIEKFTPEAAEKITRVPKEKIIEAARIYGGAKSAGVYYTMGITQHSHGTDNVFSLANLVLMTGNIGKPNAGLNPLRGQNNVQGSSDMACAPNVYPGYQKVDDEAVQKKFEAAWGVPLSNKVGLNAVDMMYAAEAGKIKGMYIMGENPVMSDPDKEHTEKVLKGIDFLVVQDIFMTETGRLADVVLPATCFAEKEGTFTNTDRTVQRVRKALEPPGDAKDDMSVIVELSKRLGLEMPNTTAETVFGEIGSVWTNMKGMNYNRLEKGGLQWPCPDENHPGTPYLFKDTFPRGKGRFTPVDFRPSEELPDDEYPLMLTTGRQLFHYHTGTMSRRVRALSTVSPKAYIEIHPLDAERLSIREGEMLKVSSRRGSIVLKARVIKSPDVGVVFIPFHFKEAAANELTNPVYDPICKIPEFKVCAVKIEKL